MICFANLDACLNMSSSAYPDVFGCADCMFMDLNMTQAELNALPPVVSVSKGAGLQLEEASQQNETIALWLPHYSSFDFNVVLLWIMAVGTFVVAGIWAGHDSVGNEHAYLKAEGSQEVCMLRIIQLAYLSQHISVAPAPFRDSSASAANT